MYLTYAEYEQRGGTLDNFAFERFNIRAEMTVNSQACGLAGQRIAKLAEIPEAVKGCIFELVGLFACYGDYSAIASESQSSGGVSESYSYAGKDVYELRAAAEDIIKTFFYGGGIGYILSKGCADED